ncbi:MAG: FAA hydrolase family protein [Planctomycetota bacterium]|nr:MAG: FAA hydrolase family protein [Planctomycetota bacterium]
MRIYRTDRGDVVEHDGECFELRGLPRAAGAWRAHALDELARGRAARVADPRDGALLAPLATRPGKMLALGKNFRAHAEEFGEAVPEEPLFFNKLPETVVGSGARVAVRAWYAQRVDHEVELAVVIGRGGADISLEHALEHVAGYTVANDLTARSLQGHDRELKYPWFRAKNMDGFCPLGPCFVPREDLDLADLAVTCVVRHADGATEERQRASTRDLVVDVPHAIEWLSRHLSLYAGDVILMGTPAGVGPLVDGDTVTCAIDGIGALVTAIARPALT